MKETFNSISKIIDDKLSDLDSEIFNKIKEYNIPLVDGNWQESLTKQRDFSESIRQINRIISNQIKQYTDVK